MRYFIGIAGGVVVALGLLVFQQVLIGGERSAPVAGTIIDPLPVPMKPKPPQRTDRQPKPPPEKPALVRPDTSFMKVSQPKVEPPRVAVNAPRGVPGGKGGWISATIGRSGSLDAGPVAKMLVAPPYPASAAREGIEGEVEVEFTIRADGSVTDVTILRATPPGVFEQAARRAVARWQFLPQQVDGRAVDTRARQVLEFRLPDR